MWERSRSGSPAPDDVARMTRRRATTREAGQLLEFQVIAPASHGEEAPGRGTRLANNHDAGFRHRGRAKRRGAPRARAPGPEVRRPTYSIGSRRSIPPSRLPWPYRTAKRLRWVLVVPVGSESDGPRGAHERARAPRDSGGRLASCSGFPRTGPRGDTARGDEGSASSSLPNDETLGAKPRAKDLAQLSTADGGRELTTSWGATEMLRRRARGRGPLVDNSK